MRLSSSSHRAAFSLLEVLVAVSILSIVAAVALPAARARLGLTRDQRRLSDVQAIKQAIDLYFLENGTYPPIGASGPGGWDVSGDGDFIPDLARKGFLPSVPQDPRGGSAHYYAYYRYPQGSYGCGGDGPFYVLGIKSFESTQFAAEHMGWFQCSGRNWNSEFAYVTGGGAGFQ
jgi:prepilin-type N-terminal cleavage/methylation domain-containing protein